MGRPLAERVGKDESCIHFAGYFDAPGAAVAPLKALPSPAVLPDVTLVFCSIEKLKDMKVACFPLPKEACRAADAPHARFASLQSERAD